MFFGPKFMGEGRTFDLAMRLKMAATFFSPTWLFFQQQIQASRILEMQSSDPQFTLASDKLVFVSFVVAESFLFFKAV